MAQGQAGFVGAVINILTGGAYTGDGINGWVGGTTFEFRVTDRNPELDRPRQDTTDGPYKEGVGGPVSMKVRLKGYFKGTIPDATFQDEFIRVTMSTAGLLFDGVVLVERFAPVGQTNEAVTWELTGETDGTFTNS